jgi:hypothetical protein
MKFAAKAMMVVACVVGLSGCSSMVDDAMFWRKKVPEPCPRVTVLQDAAQLTKFRVGPGRDLIDVLFEANVSDVLSTCYYDVDYESRAGLITAHVATVISAQRGPADTERLADLKYFVAVVDNNKDIIQKSVFPMKLAFPGNLTRNSVRDESVDLEITTDGRTDGRDYEIYIGFQLSREEMAYNRKQAER